MKPTIHRPIRVLLVDDAEVDRMAVRRALARIDLPTKVDEVVDIRTANRLLDSPDEFFDCAIVDYRLPDGDALDLIRREPAGSLRTPPVIVLTGQGSEALAVETMKAGAADYLPKSELTPSRIAQSIRNAVRVRDAEEHAAQFSHSLIASERRFRDLFENSPDAILVEDMAGNVLDANPAACRMHGLTRGEMIGINKEMLKPPDQRLEASGIFDQLASGLSDHVESRAWNRSGRVVPVEIRSSRIEFDGKQAVLLHLRDITELKEARDRLEQRVEERTADLKLAMRKLQAETAQRRAAQDRAMQLQSQLAHVGRLTTVGEMASGLAHELNQPLGAIVNYLRGCIKMIESGATDCQTLSDPIAHAAAQAERAGQIIRRLREFVAKGTPQQTPEPVHGLITEMAELLAIEAREASVQIRFDLPTDLPDVLADRIQVQQVLLNLMRNGIEAMEKTPVEERQLDVAARVLTPNLIELSVTDHGCGCEAEALAQVFDPFFTTKSSGMGMGLAISRSIIEAHSGRLIVEDNTDGRGLTFRFTLPTVNLKDHG
ncbi:PAS domain S-box protein [Planctomycetales bacterium ZRK34]|nr:PAS domain S-box protein [Planctomycetales bacterium ZRK34]